MRCIKCDKEIGEKKNCPFCGTYNETTITTPIIQTQQNTKKAGIGKLPVILSTIYTVILFVAIIATASISAKPYINDYNELEKKYTELENEKADLLTSYNNIVGSEEWKKYSSLSKSEKEILKKSADLKKEYNQLEDKSQELKESISSLKEKKKILEKADGIKKGSKKSISAGEYIVGETFPEGRFKITSNGRGGNIFSDSNDYGDDLNIIISNQSDFGVKEYIHDFTYGERVSMNTAIYIQEVE